MKGVTLDMLRGPGVESITVSGVRSFDPVADVNSISRHLAKRLSEPPDDDAKPVFVEFSHGPIGVFTLPVRLESEANAGGQLRRAFGRKSAVKRTVARHLGPYWRVWGPVGDAVRASLPATIRVVRLGGRKLDTGNLWRAVKPVEDALATLMGVDDGWPAWASAFDVGQEPGGAWGVRIEVKAAQ